MMQLLSGGRKIKIQQEEQADDVFEYFNINTNYLFINVFL
jgi:hypothetical protein